MWAYRRINASFIKPIWEKSIGIFQDDPRVICLWLEGSECRGMGDDHGDADVVLLIRDNDFEKYDSDLPQIFKDKLLFWPENFNNSEIRNYAILLDAGELIKYDLTIIRESQFPSHWFFLQWKSWKIIFDKTGITTFEKSKESTGSMPHNGCSHADLLHSIQEYWLWAFIHIKYFRRRDIFKLINAQHMLFNAHMKVLRSLMLEVEWYFWPIAVKTYLDEEKQSQMLRYFGAISPEAVQSAIFTEMKCFSHDAHKACLKWEIQYPEQLEKRVAEYLAEQMNVIKA